MRSNHHSGVHHALRRMHGDDGQMLALVALILLGILAMAGFVLDVGHIFASYRELQGITNAAALAGGQAIPAGTAVSTATYYGGGAGSVYNANSNLNITSVNAVLGCVTSSTTQLPPCTVYATPNGTDQAPANAIQVTEQAKVPLIFAALLGTSSITMTTTAFASASGGGYTPYNVGIIVDTTNSMTQQDTGGLCSGSKEYCALQGVQTLLESLAPCSPNLASCVSKGGGQVQNPVDEVSLFAFPAVTSATAPADYCSGRGRVSVQPYPLPSAPDYAPAATPTYQIVNFSSDYRTSDTATSLTTGSDLVKAAGDSCTGLQDQGGEGTYYPSVIYSAESLLVSEQALRPNTQNALIILGDGEANATQSDLASGANNSGTYPSYKQECYQAYLAAQWAAKQGVGGTQVFTVAYSSSNSPSSQYCSTDPSPYNSPCYTMEQMASNPSYFYTDVNSQKSGCTAPENQTITSLNEIFKNISTYLTTSRLLPSNTSF